MYFILYISNPRCFTEYNDNNRTLQIINLFHLQRFIIFWFLNVCVCFSLYVFLLTLRSRITHESASTYFQWGPLVLLKRQQAEETVLGYKESGCDTLALCEKIPWFFYVLSIWHRYTRELPGFHSSTSLVGWLTRSISEISSGPAWN